jgi:hypothetical protein
MLIRMLGGGSGQKAFSVCDITFERLEKLRQEQKTDPDVQESNLQQLNSWRHGISSTHIPY